MTKRDYYEVLNVDQKADSAEIKRVYRNLAMQYHPDRNPGNPQAAERMKEINEAYAVLSDPQKRQLYDTYGHAGLEGYSADDIMRGVDFSTLFREFGLGDLFGFDMFGFGREASARRNRRGADLRYDLKITLEEAASGVEKTLEIPWMEPCPACKGTGAEPGGIQECDRCHGRGQIITERRSGFAMFRQISGCNKCHGRGKVVETACPTCQGEGAIRNIREIKAKIVPGVDTGNTIKISGEGEKGESGAGDLYIVLEVAKHPLFERHGDDIYLQAEVDLVTAVLGGHIDVPSLKGTLKLDIPEGTQTGAVLRINGQGIPHLNSRGRGDQYVVVKIATPVNLTSRQKELLREFDKLQSENK